MQAITQTPQGNMNTANITHISVAAQSSRFYRFNDLPLELRRKIWKLSFPGPKRIELRLILSTTHPCDQHLDWPIDLRRRFPRDSLEHPYVEWTHRDLAPTPSHIRINHEARDIFLETYTPVRIHADTLQQYGSNTAIIYFNYATDFFIIRINHLDGLLGPFMENFRNFPNIPMNVKRFSTWRNCIQFQGSRPVFPHNSYEQNKQQVLTQGARLALAREHYRRANWDRSWKDKYEGFAMGINAEDEVFMDVL
jgi:hypothetical protein